MSPVMSARSETTSAANQKAASKGAAGSRCIGCPNDSFEQGADRVADEVMAERVHRDWSFSKVSIGTLLQRKRSCGGSGGSAGECEKCRNKNEDNNEDNNKDNDNKDKNALQRKASGPTEFDVAPPIVHDVLNSAGQPLDRVTRDFFEPRFGHDFSRVRIHVSDEAADSSRSVHARAFTVGSNIVFGSGQYRPQSREGRFLIAHELTHTLQQRPTLARSILKEGPPKSHPSGTGGVSPLLSPLLGQTQASPAAPAIPRRGSNPADCMSPICQKLSRSTSPDSDSKARDMGNDWLQGALACIGGGAAASGASHATEIVANERKEIQDEVKVLNDDFSQQHGRPSRFQDYLNNLREECQHKLREVQIEFHYNVIFENPASATATKWGFNPDWDEVEGALSALPIEATWGNPHLLRFRRDACHPDDVDPATGQCKGHGGGFVGGQTDPLGGNTDRITVYDQGLGQTPYARSASLGVPATSQTIRHEVGHVVDELIPPAGRKEFFEKIMEWHLYPWTWVVAQGSGVPKTWQDERSLLTQKTGMDGARLDQWLAGLGTSVPVVLSGITYSKDPVAGGAGDFFLNAYKADQMPGGKEFEYARTSQGEYFAEVYAFAVSKPEFLSSVLPQAQSAWLRQVVFQMLGDLKSLARQSALAEPELTEFLLRGSRLYTREQLDGLLSELTIRHRHPGSQLA